MSTTINDILASRPVLSVGPDTTLSDVANLMERHGVGALVVIENDALVGIVSERDIVFRALARGLAPETTPARAVMTPDPVTIPREAAVVDALSAHIGEAFRHLPVTENGKVVGLLSYRDIPAEYFMMYERFREMRAAHPDDGA